MERGSLFHVLADQSNRITWGMKLDFCKDIAKGMLYLHSRSPPIVHRDIKSLNVLVTKEWKCTIADFGLTRIKDSQSMSTRVGSPAWSAPEVLRGEQYDEKADVFSFGVVMWEIVMCQPPYKGMNPNQLIGQGMHWRPYRSAWLLTCGSCLHDPGPAPAYPSSLPGACAGPHDGALLGQQPPRATELRHDPRRAQGGGHPSGDRRCRLSGLREQEMYDTRHRSIYCAAKHRTVDTHAYIGG